MFSLEELEEALNASDCSVGVYEAVRGKGEEIEDFRVLWVNDAACKDFASPRERQVGRLLYKEVMPAHDIGARQAQRRVVETRKPEVYDSEMFQAPWSSAAEPAYLVFRSHFAPVGDGFIVIAYRVEP